jgi:phosphonoacetate hydrolase
MTPIHLNGIDYRLPDDPVVVVCVDGGDPAYFDRAVRDGIMPTVGRFLQEGFATVAAGTVPSFTCPNNMSIVTGAPASVHGISGNYYLDRASGEAVVMTGPELLRSSTILGEFSRTGEKVLAITAKDKLRLQLSKGLDLSGGSITFSSEKADQCSLAENGIERVADLVGMPVPHMYSPELSLFVLEAGIRLIEARRPRISFLSLSDWIQHKHAPGERESNAFHAALDDCFRRLDALGVVLAITADHGMNDKSLADGSPRVIWLQDILDAELGAGRTRVICPITDYFVAHHGALGGFVRVWCHDGVRADAVIGVARHQPGIERVLDGPTAAREFDLPLDREGDVVVIGDRGTCIGTARADHDLSGLSGHRLRSHGALTEARVPFVLNRPLVPEYERRAAFGVKSHQIFDYAINGTLGARAA